MVDIGKRPIDRLFHQIWLKGGVLEHIADGKSRFEIFDLSRQPLAKLHRVDARCDGDTYHDGRFAVKVGQGVWGIHVSALQNQQIFQSDGFICIRDLKQDIRDVLYGSEVARWLHNDVLPCGIDLTARKDHVLLNQRVHDLSYTDAVLGELCGGKLEKDLLILYAPQFHFANSL